MTGLIILAAGSSSRLGQPKQNLIFRNQTLLQRAVETAAASACEPVVVVLGANADVIRPTILNAPVNIVQNDQWPEGMASSIRKGIEEIVKISPEIKAVVLMLCDQPFVDTYLLNYLIVAKPKSGIVACNYNGILGAPVLFDATYFTELLALTGQEGAKKILTKYHSELTDVPFPNGSIDVDTLDDYDRLNKA